MSVQFIQVAQLFIYLLLAVGIVRIKEKQIKIVLIVLAVVLFAVNPVRFKQNGGEALERSVSRFEEIPKKVEVKEIPFDQFQKQELKQLKQESGDLKDEIHN